MGNSCHTVEAPGILEAYKRGLLLCDLNVLNAGTHIHSSHLKTHVKLWHHHHKNN